jgi:IS605 OrfB family transposase
MKHNFKQGDNCRTLRVVRQHAKKLSAKDTGVLQTLFADAVAVYNSALYELRQNHFKNYGTPEKPIPYEGKKICLTYGTVYNTVKTKPCYKQFNANMGQQMIMKAVGDFESYLALLAKSEAGFYNKEKVRMPRYKKHGNILVIEEITRYSKGGIFTIPRSREFKKTEKHAVRITMPPVVSDKKVKRVTLINKISHIEIFWTYECDIVKPVEIKNKYAAIDIGVNNLMTVTISDGGSFIVDGKRLKSINQFYHKQIAEIQSKHAVNGIDKWTGVQYKLLSKRESRVRDYLFKAAKILMDRLIQNKVGTLIVGVNKYRKQNIDIGKKNNQTFVSIPFWKLRRILRYKHQSGRCPKSQERLFCLCGEKRYKL